MAYTKTVWENSPSTNTPINATNLNNIEDGIEDVDTRLTTAETDIDGLQVGWLPAGETWTYSSVDDPTGVITITGDVTTKYSVGMRIKFTNGGNVIYGIVSKTPTYSSPNTTLTFLHEIDPADSLAKTLMADSAITLNYYSTMKVPYGFPIEANKWSVNVAIVSTTTQNTPNTSTYYNLGSVAITMPIGDWIFSYSVSSRINNGNNNVDKVLNIYISNSNNSLSSENLIGKQGNVGTYYLDGLNSGIINYNLTSKTVKYLLFIATAINATNSLITLYAGGYLKATCAYL